MSREARLEMTTGTAASVGRPHAASILSVDNLVKHYFPSGGGRRHGHEPVRAVDGVSFDVTRAETVGVVGESGCGKSTLGKLLVRLLEPTSGSITFTGRDISHLKGGDLREARRGMQMVFQDPYSSLNRRMTIRQILSEPLKLHSASNRSSVNARVDELLSLVGLSRRHAERFPHEFSGGQRQRIGIARALALEPRLVVLDEPASALDVSVQAQILNLIADLQERLEVSYLFISHDLSVVGHVSSRILVMYSGLIVESGTREQVFSETQHPYTHALLSAVPTHVGGGRSVRERIVLRGDVPNPAKPPSGCRFRTRCWKATDRCATEPPPLMDIGNGHLAACHYPSNDPEVSAQA